MKRSKELRGHIRFIKWWPLFLTPFILALTGVCLAAPGAAGIAALVFLFIFLVFSLGWFFYWKENLVNRILSMSDGADKLRLDYLQQLPIACAFIDFDGYILWNNKAFEDFPTAKKSGKLETVFPVLAGSIEYGKNAILEMEFEEKTYKVTVDWLGQAEDAVLTFTDITDYKEALKTIDELKPVMCRVYVDNYDDAIGSTEMVRRPVLAAFIERNINKYFAAYDGTVSKVDDDKFDIYLSRKGLYAIEEDRFSILEQVKNLKLGNEIAPTLSIGAGDGGESLELSNSYARMAIDLCLGRGGDQAIIRRPNGPVYFGGKTEKTEKSTKVRARMEAQALKELLATKDRVLIMGHKNPDTDSFGSAIGLYRIARAFEKEAHIVLNGPVPAIRPIYDKIVTSTGYGPDSFITEERALQLTDDNTLLIVTDVSRPSYCESENLVKAARSIVVIDHHRQHEEIIDNAIISYVEPYASSASEMVSELIPYISDSIKLSATEAEAMYAGIIVDTDNFLTKTGTRTFEAAAYLRRCGADMTRVRKLFRESEEHLKAKAGVVSSAEIFEDCFALGKCMAEGCDSPTIIGAQAANSLLDMKGVKASIVFTPVGDTVYISARSIDEINVQLICEKLGGGGHLSVAGAQLPGCTVDQAIDITKETIKEMIEEGAI